MTSTATLTSTNLNFTGDDGTITGCTSIILSGTPVHDSHVATKSYVDSVAEGLHVKDAVLVATTANITLSNTQTIDGVAVVAGNRVLVKDQTTAIENGIYLCVDLGSWTRAPDMPTAKSAASNFVFVEQGTIGADQGFVCTTNTGSAVVDEDGLDFTQFSGAGVITAGTNLTKTGNQINMDAVITSLTSLDTALLKLGGVSVTSNAADLNILNGVTSNAADLNLLDGSISGTIVPSKSVVYGSAGEIVASQLDVSSTTSAKPVVTITNTNDDANSSEIVLAKSSTTVGDDDSLGKITMQGKYGGNLTDFFNLEATQRRSDCGAVRIKLASDLDNTGSMATMLYMEGSEHSNNGRNIMMGLNSTANFTNWNNCHDNIGFGENTLQSLTSGDTNIAIGRNSLTGITTGNENIGVGESAGSTITTGTRNMCIGGKYSVPGDTGRDTQPSAVDGVNQIVIGFGTTGQADHSVTLGDADVTAVYCSQDSGAILHCGGLNIGGTVLTSTMDELNILAGSTANAVVNNAAVVYGSAGQVATTSSTIDPNSASGGGLIISNTTAQTSGILVDISGAGQTGGVLVDINGTEDMEALATSGLVDMDLMMTTGTGLTIANSSTQASGELIKIEGKFGKTALSIQDGYTNILTTDASNTIPANLGLLSVDTRIGGQSTDSAAIIVAGVDGKAGLLCTFGSTVVCTNSDNTKNVKIKHNGTDAIISTTSGDISFDDDNVKTTGTLACGNTTITGTMSATGVATASSYLSSSDRRLKKNIKVLKNCIDKVKKIRGVNFTWIKDDRKDYGVIAQEIEKVAPFAVQEGENGMKTVDYGKLAPLFIQSIKEQQVIIEDQQSEIDGLKEQFEELKAKVAELAK